MNKPRDGVARLLCTYDDELFSIHATVGAVPEAGLGHAAHAADGARLAHARNHLASGEARLERNRRGSVVAVGVEADAILRAFFGVVRSKAEKLGVAGDGGVAVGVDHAAHAAVHTAFDNDDAGGNVDVAVTIDAVRVACAHVNVVVAACDLEGSRASATRTESTAAKSAWTAATRVATGRCRGRSAGRIPAIVCSDDACDAAFKVHVRRFHTFVGDGDAHVGIVLDVEGLIGVDTVVVCGDGHGTTAERDGATTVDTVVSAVDVNDATADGDARIALDALHAFARGAGASATRVESAATESTTVTGGGEAQAILAAACCNLDGRGGRFSVGNRHCVVCGNAVVCRRNGDFTARDFDGPLAVCQIGGIVGIALDAVAVCGRDVEGAAADFDGTFTLEAVVLGVHGDEAVFDLQVIAGVDAVVVVALDNERAFALDGEVVLGINAGACRIGLGFAVIVGVVVSLGARRSVAEGVGRAVLGDDECLAGLLHVNRGVGRVGEREASHVQVNRGVRLCRVHQNLGVASAVATAKVVFATAADRDGAAVCRYAVAAVCDRGAACGIGDGRAFAVVLFWLLGGGARRAVDDRVPVAARRTDRQDCCATRGVSNRRNRGAARRDRRGTAVRRICGARCGGDAIGRGCGRAAGRVDRGAAFRRKLGIAGVDSFVVRIIRK